MNLYDAPYSLNLSLLLRKSLPLKLFLQKILSSFFYENEQVLGLLIFMIDDGLGHSPRFARYAKICRSCQRENGKHLTKLFLSEIPINQIWNRFPNFERLRARFTEFTYCLWLLGFKLVYEIVLRKSLGQRIK